jgi:hypothetical protein
MALIQRNEIQTANSSGGGGYYGLGREAPQEYSSGLFSSLQYEDLKKAHTESVIPVTEDDYHNVKKFRNVNELQTFRDVNRRDFRVSETEQQTAKEKALGQFLYRCSLLLSGQQHSLRYYYRLLPEFMKRSLMLRAGYESTRTT